MAKTNYMRVIDEVSRASDPKQALLKMLGDHGTEVFHARVLVATFIASEKTEGGIILPDKTKGEDRFQGSIGLVIGLGPLAFKDSPIAQFGGKSLEIHDWVMYRASDGLETLINGVPCRIFEDVRIQMRVRDPSIYY